MSSRSHERRTERATAEEVAEVERQLWEFAKRIDPPGVPEAKLRPGAFLYRVHRTWHSLGRGTGGLASRSFRALRDELLKRDPPVRNLQPKLYGATALSQAEAEQLVDVMLETWHLERGRNGKWQAKPLFHDHVAQPAGSHDREAIRENLLHTLFKGDDHLLLEEPVGVPPEIFLEERGRSSLALIMPTKGETTVRLSPFNAYGGFSSGMERFFTAAARRLAERQSMPLVIWVLRLDAIRDNAEYHQSFHSLAVYSACLTNWYFRLSRKHEKEENQEFWSTFLKHCAFVVYGLPRWTNKMEEKLATFDENLADQDLNELGPEFLVPYNLPIVLNNHRQIRRHQDHDFGLNVSIEPDMEGMRPDGGRLHYWLFPDHPKSDPEETAETTGLPVFDAEMSPGKDFDLAYTAVYEAVAFHLGFSDDARSRLSHETLLSMNWQILTIDEFQRSLIVLPQLGG